jgi:hypothetical protein
VCSSDTRSEHAIAIKDVLADAGPDVWESVLSEARGLEVWQQERMERYQRRIQYLLSQGIDINEPMGLDEYISEDDLEDINELGNYEIDVDSAIDPPPDEPDCTTIDSLLPKFKRYASGVCPCCCVSLIRCAVGSRWCSMVIAQLAKHYGENTMAQRLSSPLAASATSTTSTSSSSE